MPTSSAARLGQPAGATSASGVLPAARFSKTRQRGACSTCAMRHLCLPHGVSADDMPKLEALVRTALTVKRGATLYGCGDAFDHVYAVRSGSFKTVLPHTDGREQVTGLHLAGEALGLDGLGDDAHACKAVALEDSSVCAIPYDALNTLCREAESLQRRLHRLMGEGMVRKSAQMLLLGTLNAEERVAAFLLDLSARHARHGYSASEFLLRMTRAELGSYLGMTLETVSRVLSRLQSRGLIAMQGKIVRIVEFAQLRGLAGA